MSKILRLYNSFTRGLNNVELQGKILSANSNDCKPIRGSLYVCGPTVYEESHLGHALTYIRADLFRRFMRSLFNVRLTTVMNITDIDDKILAKAHAEGSKPGSEPTIASDKKLAADGTGVDHSSHPFHKISDKYYRLFLRDMDSLRVRRPDLIIRVSRQVQLIMDYIKKLESRGNAYVAENGDIYFSVQSIPSYEGMVDSRKNDTNDPAKKDSRDFALWKASKSNEPVWFYRSDVSGKIVPGRPGWHVQCSAISSAIFGDKLDFHYGGRDLMFPHHYNEEACCCAYHGLNTEKTIHVWSGNWLHSGHMILSKEKMSKSLGNVIAIDNFVSRSSVNALRLLCIDSHYRANIEYTDDLLADLKFLDHKLGAFVSYLADRLSQVGDEKLALDGHLSDNDLTGSNCVNEIEAAILATHNEIIHGACEDLDLERGLSAIMKLAQIIYSKDASSLGPAQLVSAWHLLKDWCSISGLEYGSLGSSQQNDTLVELVRNYRQSVRHLAIKGLKDKQGGDGGAEFFKSILVESDTVRSQLDDFGFVIRDNKS